MSIKKIAVFDFDETIISQDTLINYIRFLLKQNRVLNFTGAILFKMLDLLGKSLSARKFIISAMLWIGTVGLGKAGLKNRTDEFIDSFFSGSNHVKVYTKAIEKLEWHVAHNHSVIILSASPERLIKLIMSRIAPTINCQIIGSTEKKILGGIILNDYCSGQNKVVLAHLAGLPENQWEYVYSDSSRDLPIFLHGKERFLINPTDKTVADTKKVLNEKFEILHWQ